MAIPNLKIAPCQILAIKKMTIKRMPARSFPCPFDRLTIIRVMVSNDRQIGYSLSRREFTSTKRPHHRRIHRRHVVNHASPTTCHSRERTADVAPLRSLSSNSPKVPVFYNVVTVNVNDQPHATYSQEYITSNVLHSLINFSVARRPAPLGG